MYVYTEMNENFVFVLYFAFFFYEFCKIKDVFFCHKFKWECFDMFNEIEQQQK
jgi:hypothetical protein